MEQSMDAGDQDDSMVFYLEAFKISHDQYKRAEIKESIIQDLVEAYKKGLGAQESEDKSKLPVNS